MSKVVSGIGNAVSSVVKGAVKAVSGIAKNVGGLVKSIASSKLGKAVLIAAAIYFGGAALSGGFSIRRRLQTYTPAVPEVFHVKRIT